MRINNPNSVFEVVVQKLPLTTDDVPSPSNILYMIATSALRLRNGMMSIGIGGSTIDAELGRLSAIGVTTSFLPRNDFAQRIDKVFQFDLARGICLLMNALGTPV